MKKIALVFLLVAGCRTPPPPVSLEETARNIHGEIRGKECGLFFRDLEDGETLEILAETLFLDPWGRNLSIVDRVLEEVGAGRISWSTVKSDLSKMLRHQDADASVNLVSHLGRDAETSISPRMCSRLVQGFFSNPYPPEIRGFLDENAKYLGRFKSSSGRFYLAILLSNGKENRIPDAPIHAYMESKR